MKKLIFPILFLLFLFLFAFLTLRIPESLPENANIPSEVKEILEPERIEKAILYSNFRYGWYFFSEIFSFAILIGVLFLGISGRIRDWAKTLSEKIASLPSAPLLTGSAAILAALLITFLSATKDHPVSGGALSFVLLWGIVGTFAGRYPKFGFTALYLLLFSLLITTLQFPLNYYRNFVVEHYFELSTETFGKWFADVVKGELISNLFLILLIPLAYWGIQKRPRDWWLWIAGGSIPIMIFFIVITPVYVDPLFDKFEPLQDETLRDQILAVAEEAGIQGGKVFQVDKSKDTEKMNAYVTGLFNTKRIVLWDTTLEKLTSDEILFVMGHEMGHYILHHIWKFVGIFSITIFILLYIIFKTIGLITRKWGERMRFTQVQDIASLPLLMLMLSLLLFFISPIFNTYSRSIEHDADVFGLNLTRNGSLAAQAFVKLANENLSNPSPHPFIEFWLFSHPTLKDRIAFCKNYSKADPNEK
ncbi:M48 family metallopeptidase [candidate division TA06 bacterium]|nr:M48 family metallopeptidase [candidate division TA06 bacterium]